MSCLVGSVGIVRSPYVCPLVSTLPQEVLILGAVLGNAKRVVSAVAEDTVTVGILPSATTQDE